MYSLTPCQIISDEITFFIVIHCVWDHWEIGECSKTCGTGTRTNIRTKLIEEQNGGTCSGDPAEFEACNTMDCPTGTFQYIYIYIYIYFIYPPPRGIIKY